MACNAELVDSTTSTARTGRGRAAERRRRRRFAVDLPSGAGGVAALHVEDVEALARVQVEERAVVQERVPANVVTRVGVIGLEVVGILGDLLDPSHQTPLPVVDGEDRKSVV